MLRKRLRGKRAVGKAARTKRKPDRQGERFRLDELTFGTLNCFLGCGALSEYFVSSPFPLRMETTFYAFLPDGDFSWG